MAKALFRVLKKALFLELLAVQNLTHLYMYFSIWRLFVFSFSPQFLSFYLNTLLYLNSKLMLFPTKYLFHSINVQFSFTFNSNSSKDLAPSHLAITLPYASNGPGANNHFPTVPTYSWFFLQHARQKQLLILVVVRL